MAGEPRDDVTTAMQTLVRLLELDEIIEGLRAGRTGADEEPTQVERPGPGSRDRIARLDRERVRLRRALPAHLLESYDALRRAGCLPPVATANEGRCSGCRARLTPATLLALAESRDVTRCPGCRRLLAFP